MVVFRFRCDVGCCFCKREPHHLIESKPPKEKISRLMDENMHAVLKQSPHKSLSDVDLVFFPMIKMSKESHHFYLVCFNLKTVEIDIIDNIDNDLEDLDVRYGAYANTVIFAFVNYLGRVDNPRYVHFLIAVPTIINMHWRTTFNGSDCGIFVMRHMETYVGRGIFLHELKKESVGLKVQLKLLRTK